MLRHHDYVNLITSAIACRQLHARAVVQYGII